MKGIVVKSTGSLYTVQRPSGEKIACTFKGSFKIKNIKSTNPIAVGDNVEFLLNEVEKTGLITEIFPRENYIIRKSINLSKETHILAANIDRAYLVITIAKPRTSTGFINRFLVSAEAYHIPTTLLFNKIDLLTKEQLDAQDQLRAIYEKIGYECIFISALTKTNLSILHGKFAGKINLLCGHSGTGKSTLINAIDPKLILKTTEISSAHDKGKHTTTFAEMHQLTTGGFIIDTPGIKELGLIDINKTELSGYFPEMFKLSHHCKFTNCTHVTEPKCAVKEAVETGEIAASRYQDYLSMLSGD